MKKLNPWYKSSLFFFHILTHLSVIPMILFGDWYHWVLAIIMYFVYGCLGVAITYHRLISHKSFIAPKWFIKLGMLSGTLCGVGSSIQWTAVHRNHHRFSDTTDDPHNPHGGLKNFLKMQFLTMLVPSNHKYVVDLLRDPMHVWFHKHYWKIHLVFACILVLIDPFALVYAYLFPCFVFWHVMSALGTFAHVRNFGYQNYETKDQSTNLWFLGWFTFGEGWHNNHHAKPADYKFGRKKYEVDLGAFIIDLIKK